MTRSCPPVIARARRRTPTALLVAAAIAGATHWAGAAASTAGAICLDRACGRLDQILVTDLSDSEVVLGKLGARRFSDRDIPILSVMHD